MKDNKTCKNGHLYEPTLKDCPYCPQGDSLDATILDSTDLDATVDASDKTVIMGNQREDKTAIHQPGSTDAENYSMVGRKLVGWLVSYTWNKEGDDYQLREGKTTIGANTSSDICLSDNELSDNHATILYRSDKFKIKDEFTTNGTYINGKEIDEQSVLTDGDIIKVGKTEFKFREI